jgi:seryl-tRNA synthetase
VLDAVGSRMHDLLLNAHIPVALQLHRLYSSDTRPTSDLPSPRLDYKGIADNVINKRLNAIRRKAPVSSDAVESIVRAYNEHKRISASLNAKRNHRSSLGQKFKGKADSASDEDRKASIEEAKALKEDISHLESELDVVQKGLLAAALALPNDTHPASPLGAEDAAITIGTGGPERIPSDSRRDHVRIGQALGMLDLESGSNVTGTSWYYLLNEGALLELALINYAVSVAVKQGFTPVITPDVVRSDVATRCGFQPRDHSNPPVNQFYHVETGSPSSPELVLSGTAEIPLAGMFADKIFPSTSLPLKVVGVGKAFRAEAGARGADTRGLYRVHQFSKVELFAVTNVDSSEAMMEEMRALQTVILDGLGLTYR